MKAGILFSTGCLVIAALLASCDSIELLQDNAKGDRQSSSLAEGQTGRHSELSVTFSVGEETTPTSEHSITETPANKPRETETHAFRRASTATPTLTPTATIMATTLHTAMVIQEDLDQAPVPDQTDGSTDNVPTITPTQPIPYLTISPLYQELPAGSSAMFRIIADDPCSDYYNHTFEVKELPSGITAEFLGDPVPCRNTLVLHTEGTLAPGSYTVRVFSKQTGTSITKASRITLNITACSEFLPGEFTQTIQSKLVTLITAGKPAIEHGLLVPLQVCQNRSLQVTLTVATSEAGTPMSAPPRFYLYRSMAWPAPSSITAHGHPCYHNVRVPRSNSNGWQLQADISPGLYLLVFERDHWTGSPDVDPANYPASVTYHLE
ncbi:MAG: hypothetical protein JXB30_13480 [Anaerolineae bacterium]|nr:hypothetical protein [Anaerolineae bacterium]